MKLKHIVCALIISLGAVCPAYAGYPVEAKADARALVEAGAEAVGRMGAGAHTCGKYPYRGTPCC